MARPLIQLALDSLDVGQTLTLASLAAPYVDIFEIGTPCIKHNGISLVRELKKKFPFCLLRLILPENPDKDVALLSTLRYEASGL